MSAITVPPPHTAVGSPADKTFRVGTLEYSQKDLYVLFVWLMWNEAMVTLLQDPPGFGGFLQKDFGATNAQIAIWGTIGTFLNVIINPVFSTWSDRTRSRWGRRRPFLVIFTPPLALFTMALPFMPDLAHWLRHFPAMHDLGRHLPLHMNGTVFMLGACGFCITFFNAIVGTLFSYLYWDVVPQNVLGRWTSLNKIVAAVCGFIWSFFLFGLADHHLKALCIGASLFSLVVYLLSIYKVKEGEYPPVDKHEHGPSAFAAIYAYFVECFSKPYYLWIFGAFAFSSINWSTGGFINFYLRYNLHLNYEEIGPLNGAPNLISIVLGYYLGSMADKLHPMRIFVPTFLALGLIYVASFFFVHDKWTYLFFTCLVALAQFANGITYGALLPQLFPREKFGQFCSANAICSMGTNMLIGLPLGWMFDQLNSEYRYAYLVAAFSMFGAAALFHKVAKNFAQRHGHIPVPHAG